MSVPISRLTVINVGYTSSRDRRVLRSDMKKFVITLGLLLGVLIALHWCVRNEQSTSFDNAVAAMSDVSLPLVNLDIDLDGVNDAGYTGGKITIIERVVDSVVRLDTLQSACLLKVRGASAKKYDKKSYSLKLVSDKGDKIKVGVLGMREDNVWILDAMASDPSRMRNRVCFDVWNEYSRLPYETAFAGRNGTEGKFVEVYVKGKYHGLYCLSDKINRKLLGLKNVKTDNDPGDVLVRGVLYKGKDWTTATTLGDYRDMRTDSVYSDGWQLCYPDDYPSEKSWQPLTNLIETLGKDDATVTATYQDWFYVDNLVDYWLLLEQFHILDMPYKNAYLSTVNVNDAHRFVITPWDLDASLGCSFDGTRFDSVSVLKFYEKFGPFRTLLGNNVDGINDKLEQRWNELSVTVFAPSNVMKLMRGYAEQMDRSGAWQRERARWNGNPVKLGETAASELEYVEWWYGRNYEHMRTSFPYR